MDPLISAVCRLTVAALLATAAVSKLRDLRAFRHAVADYEVIPRRLAAPVAPVVPVLELAAAAALVVPATRAAGAVLALALIAAFTAALAVNLQRGRTDIDCGCFGPAAEQGLSGWLIPRNLLLAAFTLPAFWPPGARPLGALDLFVLVAGMLGLSGMFLALNRLIALAPRTAALRRPK